MPRIPKPPVPNCHIPISASEDIKLKVMEARLLEQLQGDFIASNNIKTINNESLIGEGDIHIKNIKEIRLLEETTDHTKYEIVFNDPADLPYTFTVKNEKQKLVALQSSARYSYWQSQLRIIGRYFLSNFYI